MAAGSASGNRAPQRFFGVKQVFIFMFMAFAIIMIDLILLFGIVLVESQAENTPESGTTTIRHLADALEEDENGTWALADPDLERTLAQMDCWAAFVAEDGTVLWTYATPDDFPVSFTRNEIAVISHDRMWGNATVFIWTKDDDLVLLGYPYEQFVFWGITLSQDSFVRIPVYCLCVFLVDLLIIFSLYTLSQRSIMKNIGPTLDALDDLAQGRTARVRFTGMLRVVGERINRVSDTLLRKETARKNWVAGVSHDVRTPLAIVMGHAERIENDATLPQATRDSAAVITRQGVRIRDLVEDLNIATQLEYDMQPLNITAISLPRLMRDVVADYLNQGLERDASLELDIADDALRATLAGDERLLKRALRNAVDNSLKHNAYCCTVTLSLAREAGCTALTIADDGRGMAPDQLAALVDTLEKDYLGTGSVVEHSETSATLAASGTLSPHGSAAPGSPAPPPEATSDTYPGFPPSPVIASQRDPYDRTPRAARKKRRPPVPPALTSQDAANGAATGRAAQPSDVGGAPNGAPASAHPGSAREIPRSGTIGQHGLGMPLIARIAIVHGATFAVRSVEGEGFAIVMRFPTKD